MNRRAVTLIELLIAIGIILLLAGLLLPAVRGIREKARWLDTSNRISQVGQALSAMGQDDGGATIALLRAAGAGGVLRLDPTDPQTPIEGTWFDYDPTNRAWQLRFPLERQTITFTGRNKEDGSVNESYLPVDGKPIDFALSESEAGFTAKLMAAAGIAPNEAAARSDRSPTKAWNDAWGNPILISVAVWQYGPISSGALSRWPQSNNSHETTPMTNARHYFWRRMYQEATRYLEGSQASWVWLAAAGPKAALPSATLSDADYQTMWSTVESTVNRDDAGAPLWHSHPANNQRPLAEPPWTGLRVEQRMAIQAPLSLR
ncbi:MAG: hypothetical protein PF961_19950 [Planctomycetota bacterium]|jgi:type II secretory pathway pseudopilin PulG|nr:hypothetical protein [Planctomycetota bacterium]